MGRTGEKRVADELEGRGFFVIPSYDYTGSDGNKAPKMRRGNEHIIVPDLDVCVVGARYWVEIKSKSTASLYRNTQTWEHGIDRPHWDAYKRIQIESGNRVFLCILEKDTGKMLMASIDKLETVMRHGRGRGRHMVYFPRGGFTDWGERRGVASNVENG